MTTKKLLSLISLDNDKITKLGNWLFWSAIFVATLAAAPQAQAQVTDPCAGKQKITADVVVLDNPTLFNRLGAQNPNWITYALKRDVVHKSSTWNSQSGQVCQLPNGDDNGCKAGEVELRPDKRTRPLVVRSVAGACLTVNFTNLLAPVANPNNFIDNPKSDTDDIMINNDQVAGRCAGFHASGTELVSKMSDDGSMVGANAGSVGPDAGTKDCGLAGSGLVPPDGTIIYELYTPYEGAFVINSYGATLGSEANGGNLGLGMFGALNVQPKGARIYRSQVTEEEMRLATLEYAENECAKLETAGAKGLVWGIDCDPGGQPILDYEATYPEHDPWESEGKAGLPILNMLTPDGRLVHSDINAIIAGPDADGSWKSVCKAKQAGDTSISPDCPYPLESVGRTNPQLPDRILPFREFTSIFHDEQTNAQAFPKWYGHPVLGYTLDGVGDAFMINYGSGGIGSEIIANRLHAGPMHDCTDCAYEEFFLSSSTVGDPAQLVNFPANTGIEQCDPTDIKSPNCWRQFLINADVNGDEIVDEGGEAVGANPPIPGNYALFQEDPSNVHHAYVGDHTKIRNTHAGAFEQHIFHLHNHQWLFNPNDDNANYLDAQEIMPGSGHTYELVNGGVGNRNHTTGDAIFHCHFYPHFAQGMWYHIRIMDVFEKGTVLAVSNADDPQNPSLYDMNNKYANFHDNSDGKWKLRNGRPAKGSRALPDAELPDGAPIPAIVPLPGKSMAPMPAKVEVMAVDRGDFGVLSGRRPAGGVLKQGPDSAQAVVDFVSVKGRDGQLGTADDVSPGYPFWLAGNSCGVGGDVLTGECPEGTIGQRQPTPVLDMLTDSGAKDLSPAQIANPDCDTDPELGDGKCLAADGEVISDMIGTWERLGGGWDGGLPRHNLRGYTSGGLSLDTQNRLDFRKVIKSVQPVYYPETGTALEDVSMRWQAVRIRPSVANMLGGSGYNYKKNVPFVMNGSPPVPGGPYNDPCIDDRGNWAVSGKKHEWYDGKDLDRNSLLTRGGSPKHGAESPRTYKIANVQIDAVFNKVGHHYSQERIIALWEDVKPTINKQRPPEPLVMRFNTFDCGKILHSNLVPAEFEVDDFQVRTPTDIIGQHIHLPKWDLTTGDGAANGWNYEDGALSPLMVQERIEAINNFNALAGGRVNLKWLLIDEAGLNIPEDRFAPNLLNAIAKHWVDLTDLEAVRTIDTGDPGSGDPTLYGEFCEDEYGDPYDCYYDYGNGLTHLKALPHPFFKKGNLVNGHYEYEGARTVIQRILVDPVVNVAGQDRGLGLTFSHDHYGPSTFQQIGLYSTILAEPAASDWYHNESGEKLGTRPDGGPTTWQAAIITPNTAVLSNVGAEDVVDHREFYFEMSDFQHAYNAGTYVGACPDGRPGQGEGCEFEVAGKLGQVHKIVQDDYFDATRARAPNIEGKWRETVNPTLKVEAHVFPDVVTARGACPGAAGNFDKSVPRPCAEAINIGHSSTWVTNYRNEPVGLRIFDPNAKGPDGQNGTQAAGKAGDLAFALQSRSDRAISEMGTAFGNTPYPTGPAYCEGSKGDYINCDRGNGDPFTPIMRAYEGDEVKIKIQVGATEEQHQTTVHGIKWLSNGSGFGRSPNSGWRNFQSHGISEQFSLQVPVIADPLEPGKPADYFYATDATRPGFWLGTWGILRSYTSNRQDLTELVDNPFKERTRIVNKQDFAGVCPKTANVMTFDVYAVLANKVLPNKLGVNIEANLPPKDTCVAPKGTGGDSDGDCVGDNVGGPLDPGGGTLVYNRRGTEVPTLSDVWTGGKGPLNDPTGMMYVLAEDLVPADPEDARCYEETVAEETTTTTTTKGKKGGGKGGGGGDTQPTRDYNIALEGCPVKLKYDAPVEPLVLRAKAGDCIEVTLHNKLVDQAQYQVGVVDDKPVYEHVYSCNVDQIALQDVYDADGNLVSEGYYQCDPVEPYKGLFDTDSASDYLDQGKMLVLADGTIIQYMDENGALVKHGDIKFNDRMPDLAGYQTMMWAVTRRVEDNPGENNPPTPKDPTDDEMYFFDNNLIRPSAYVGLHPQLVEYDITRDDGTVVGNNTTQTLATPGGKTSYKWYAGDLYHEKTSKGINIVATPIEFGASNLLSADRLKQPQKGMFGALAIEPPDAFWKPDLDLVPDGQGMGFATRKTRAQMTINSERNDAGSGGNFREALAIGHKIANLRWWDGSAIKNVNQEEFGREGAEDSGHAGFNYGMEPSWFRFKLPPNVPSGNALQVPGYGSIPNVQAFYANELVKGEGNAIQDIPGVSVLGDPQTPVFRTTAGMPTRMHVLNGASADRDGTFILHGHLWQRDPFVCTGEAQDKSVPLPGRCDPYLKAPSQRLGVNPQGKYMGGEEGMGHVYGHWPILFNAGGTYGVPGDYLYRDYAPNGNRNGMFGILRVEE